MKRRNFFKALGGLAMVPVAAKAAPGGTGGEKVIPYKKTDPILPSYERYAGYEPIHDDFPSQADIDAFDVYARKFEDGLLDPSKAVDAVTQNNAILATLKAKGKFV